MGKSASCPGPHQSLYRELFCLAALTGVWGERRGSIPSLLFPQAHSGFPFPAWLSLGGASDDPASATAPWHRDLGPDPTLWPLLQCSLYSSTLRCAISVTWDRGPLK